MANHRADELQAAAHVVGEAAHELGIAEPAVEARRRTASGLPRAA